MYTRYTQKIIKAKKKQSPNIQLWEIFGSNIDSICGYLPIAAITPLLL
jgi:hypothetical protein